MMGIFCSLLCCGLLSSGCTHLVECGRTSSLITVKINFKQSQLLQTEVGSSEHPSHSGGGGDSHSFSPATEQGEQAGGARASWAAMPRRRLKPAASDVICQGFCWVFSYISTPPKNNPFFFVL